jgi:hypothetical protein
VPRGGGGGCRDDLHDDGSYLPNLIWQERRDGRPASFLSKDFALVRPAGAWQSSLVPAGMTVVPGN